MAKGLLLKTKAQIIAALDLRQCFKVFGKPQREMRERNSGFDRRATGSRHRRDFARAENS